MQGSESNETPLANNPPGNYSESAYLRMTGEALGRGDLNTAARSALSALRLNPAGIAGLSLLGDTLKKSGDPVSALRFCSRALALNPASPALYTEAGDLLLACRKYDQAMNYILRALKLEPASLHSLRNLGNALLEGNKPAESIKFYKMAIAIAPETASLFNNIGIALNLLHRLDEAIINYEHALKLNRNYFSAYLNISNVLRQKHDLGQALAACRKALELEPENADARFNYGMLLLMTGDFRSGWREYEWRFRQKKVLYTRHNQAQKPDTSDLNGKTVLLYAEQGFGDAMQFLRFVSRFKDSGCRIILEVKKELIRLAGCIPGIGRIILNTDPVPPHDYSCSLLSLPFLFGCHTPDSLTMDAPYLFADKGLSSAWRERLPASGKFRIGLVWAGGKRPDEFINDAMDRRRSMRLRTFAPLAGVEGVELYSLQKGEPGREAMNPPEGMRLVDYTRELADFADTAALVDNLDMVVTVDTSVAHLAAAMGRPVWMLSRFDCCWRWLTEREDSIWYPSMRIFRQRRDGDWEEVVAKVAAELGKLLAGRG